MTEVQQFLEGAWREAQAELNAREEELRLKEAAKLNADRLRRASDAFKAAKIEMGNNSQVVGWIAVALLFTGPLAITSLLATIAFLFFVIRGKASSYQSGHYAGGCAMLFWLFILINLAYAVIVHNRWSF